MAMRAQCGGAAARLVAAIAAASLLAGVRGSRLFVSPQGHDTHGDGSEERPFRSVQAAVDAAWDFDVVVLMDGVHTSDTEIRFQRRKLAVRAQHGPNTRTGGCWPVHTGDAATPTLTRCNITSWPQKWDPVQNSDDDAWETQATSVQELPPSLADAGRNVLGFHGASRRPIPASEGGDFADPGDSPRSSAADTTCGPTGCLLGFHGTGNLQAGINSRTTLVGARFVFLDGDEVILRDLDIRGRPGIDGGTAGGYRSEPEDGGAYLEVAEGGCLQASGLANVTIADSSFSFCSASHAGGAVHLGYQANVWFNSVRFLNNSGGIRGGAVQLEMEANVRFTNCEFSGNSAQSGAAASIADGASPVFDKCDFYSNSASKGGAIHLDGDSRCNVTDSAFVHNSALEGGAIFATDLSRPAFHNCTFQNNSATVVGGAILVDEESVVGMTGCALFFNRAERGGGALVSLAPDPTLFRDSHSTYPVWASANLTNCHFGFNSAGTGAAHVHPLSLAAAILDTDPLLHDIPAQDLPGWRPRYSDWQASSAAASAGAEAGAGVKGQTLDVAWGRGNTVCSGRGRSADAFALLCTCGLPYVGGDEECAVTCPGYLPPNSSAVAAAGSRAATDATGAKGVVCSGHGRCLHKTAARDRECRWFGGRRWFCVDRGLARCSCSFGYVGTNCSQRCPGWNALAPGARGGRQVCSGHGSCTIFNGTAGCSCDFGWAGAECDELRLYVLASGGGPAKYNRIIRLADKVLVNSREQGLHLLALNRSDLTVVWDRNYEVMTFLGPDNFYPLGDNDGTINVPPGSAQDGSTGSLNASIGGLLMRNPQLSEVYFREDEANRMARDLSLLDGRHLVVVTSFLAWENQTNPALVQALARIGGPDLTPYTANKEGEGHALVIVGVPDVGTGNGTYMLGPLPSRNATPPILTSYSEVEVNLALRFETKDVPWCGARVYRDGIDVSHLTGTACVNARTATVETYVDGVDGVLGGGGEEGKLRGASPTFRTDKVPSGSTGPREQRTLGDSTLRWRVVPRTTASGHHVGGIKLESWDLSSDFDPSTGIGPLLVSNATILQECCNRTLRWDHGSCRRGRSVGSSTFTVGGEKLLCLESGWMTGDGSAWPGMYGNLDLTGASGHTLNFHTPPWDAAPLQDAYGTLALYNMQPGHRNTPFTAEDIDVNNRIPDAEEVFDGQGPYAMFRSRPTPTTIYKNCDVGRAECDPTRGASMGFAVPHECEREQCNANTGDVMWEQDV
jgi:hypothetical protein